MKIDDIIVYLGQEMEYCLYESLFTFFCIYCIIKMIEFLFEYRYKLIPLDKLR